MSGRLHRFVEFLYIKPAIELIKGHKHEFAYAALSLILIFFVAGGNLQLLLVFISEALNDSLGIGDGWVHYTWFTGADIIFALLGLVGLWAVFTRLSNLPSTKIAAVRSALVLFGFVAVVHMSGAIYAAGMTFFFSNPFATPIILISTLALYIMLAISLRREKFDLSAAKYGFWALVVWGFIVGALLAPIAILVTVIFSVEGMASLDTSFFWSIVIIYHSIIIIGQHIFFAAVAIAAQDKAICDEQKELGA